MKSTNYYNTFISVAQTCKKTAGTIPPQKTPPTVAQLEYEIITANPYSLTSDEIQFEVYKRRNKNACLEDFAKINHACFRCSSLSQNYGWGFHFNEDGKVALFAVESEDYQHLLDNGEITQKLAFSSTK